MIRVLAAFPLALALALAGCGDKADQPANDTRSAEGEVLGGTISDAMLPLETVKSQSPPLRASPSPGVGGADAPAEADDSDEAEAPAQTPPAESAPEPTAEDEA